MGEKPIEINPRSVLGQGLVNAAPGLQEAVRKLKEHEHADDESVNEELLKELRRVTEENQRMARELGTIKSDRESALEKLKETQAKYSYEQKRRRAVRQVIGVTGIHPNVLDVEVETTVMNGRKTQIAWVPVIVWEVPVQNENRPWFTWKDREGKEHKRPNLDIGSTRIAESYATATICDKNGKEHQVTFTGFCTLNMSTRKPEEIARRLERAERKQNWELVSDTRDEPEGAENEAHAGDETYEPDPEMSFEQGAFTVRGQVQPANKHEGRTDKTGSPNDEE